MHHVLSFFQPVTKCVDTLDNLDWENVQHAVDTYWGARINSLIHYLKISFDECSENNYQFFCDDALYVPGIIDTGACASHIKIFITGNFVVFFLFASFFFVFPKR